MMAITTNNSMRVNAARRGDCGLMKVARCQGLRWVQMGRRIREFPALGRPLHHRWSAQICQTLMSLPGPEALQRFGRGRADALGFLLVVRQLLQFCNGLPCAELAARAV